MSSQLGNKLRKWKNDSEQLEQIKQQEGTIEEIRDKLKMINELKQLYQTMNKITIEPDIEQLKTMIQSIIKFTETWDEIIGKIKTYARYPEQVAEATIFLQIRYLKRWVDTAIRGEI